MRILHTADLHLGKTLKKTSMLEDQEHFLFVQLQEAIRDLSPNAIVIAGDVYDRPVPPTAAVELFDECCRKIVMDHNVPIIVIPGNHDGPERLSFGAQIMSSSGMHIIKEASPPPIILSDEYGDVAFFASGYSDPLALQGKLEDPSIVCHDSAFAVICDRFRRQLSAEARSVMIAHAFVQGGATCDSERDLVVGGQELVGVDRFAGFDYVALGHLHRPQDFDGGRVRYSGSPLAYSFSEAGQSKSITMVELGRKGGPLHVKEVGIVPKRKIAVLSGAFEALLRMRPGENANKDDLIFVNLTDESPVFEAMSRLKEIWPNIVDLEYPERSPSTFQDELFSGETNRKVRSPIELFAEFFLKHEGKILDEEQMEIAATAIHGASKDEGAIS
jgi:exonuclease SbcD